MLRPWLNLWAVSRTARLLEKALPGVVNEWTVRDHPEFLRLFAYNLTKALSKASPAWGLKNQLWMRRAYLALEKEEE